jgi:hypothetical protein
MGSFNTGFAATKLSDDGVSFLVFLGNSAVGNVIPLPDGDGMVGSNSGRVIFET